MQLTEMISKLKSRGFSKVQMWSGKKMIEMVDWVWILGEVIKEGMMLIGQDLKSNCDNFKVDTLANREPVQIS